MRALTFILVLATAGFSAARTAGEPKLRPADDDGDHRNLGAHPTPRQRVMEDGSLRALEDSAFWNARCQAELADQLAKTPIVSQAKNVIVFLGDGTGIATFTAARLLKGQRSGKYELEQSAWERFPFSSIIKTYNTNLFRIHNDSPS
ncbi:intestinal-type alkaline phosphatase-like [Hyalella azteca]|uniref:alkaline phosphatase n=1 Tax=Hyalella azteca TaxID=294128 RepID=A0A8B7NIC2_HYAAZ|nr:intestinal-type alkaline phosphatase-like [Hyalella azteca]